MIIIYRRLKDSNNFVAYPKNDSVAAPQTTTNAPMNDYHSFRFPFSYAYKSKIPNDAIIKQNMYYKDLFLEIVL